MTPMLLSLLLAQGLPIKDSDSSTLLQLDGNGRAGVVAYGVDGGYPVLSDKYGALPEFTDDGRIDTGRDTPLFRDMFVGSAVAAHNRWNQSILTQTTTVSGGAITLNASAITTINTYSTLLTVQKFRSYVDGALYWHARAKPVNLPQTNALAELGMGNALTNAAPTDGLFFRWTASGGFECVVNRGGAETSSSMTAPASGVYSVFAISATADSFTCTYETPSSGASARTVITLDSGAPGLFNESPGGMLRVVNGASAPALAPQLSVGIFEISVKVQDLSRADVRETAQGLSSVYLATTGAQNANHANSASPASASLSNIAAGYATLGGRYQFAAVAGAATDFALFGIATPVSFRLIVTGVTISACLEGAAIATTATRLDWALGVGSTAVSLATGDTIAATPTSAPRRIPIGSQGFPLVAPRGPAQIGDCAENINVSFAGAPLVVESGRFFHVILQVPVGTATASQVFRGVVQVTGRYEQ